jgi:adenylate cyclase
VAEETESTFLVHATGGRRFPLVHGQSWAVGRGDGCAVMLDSRSVSRLHALIQRRENGEFSVVDLGSRNGSFVNGRRVSVPVVLNDQDHLMFGDQELVFRNVAGVSAGSAAALFDTRNAPTTSLHTQSLTTIVVVDIRDFTRLARTVSEALLSQTVGTWFLRVGQAVQRLGSWAQKYIGDATMAVWVHDHPAHLRSDLLRALRAVVDIHAATEEISRSLPIPEPLRIGAGINTGSAIVGGTEYTALGETVNAAFRLEAASKQLGLSVVLGDRTYCELRVPPPSPFARSEVQLKGYEAKSIAWAISFRDLQEFLETPGR